MLRRFGPLMTLGITLCVIGAVYLFLLFEKNPPGRAPWCTAFALLGVGAATCWLSVRPRQRWRKSEFWVPVGVSALLLWWGGVLNSGYIRHNPRLALAAGSVVGALILLVVSAEGLRYMIKGP